MIKQNIPFSLQEKINTFPNKRKERIYKKIKKIGDGVNQLLGKQIYNEYQENLEKINKIEELINLFNEEPIVDDNDYRIVNIKNNKGIIGNYGIIKKDNITYQLNSLLTCNNYQKIPLPPGITLIDTKIPNLGSAILYKIIENIKNKGGEKIELEFNNDVKIFYEKILYIFIQQNIIKEYEYVESFEKPNIFDTMLDNISSHKLNKIKIVLK